jgi:O-6-methylguanine DNA methyltransferase
MGNWIVQWTPLITRLPNYPITRFDVLTLFRSHIATPIGDMCALASGTALCALEFDGPRRRDRLDARLRRWFPPHAIEDADSPVLVQTRGWLADYFAGQRASVADIPLEFHGAAFEQRVWRALLEIPAGETRSYGAIAKALGCAGASRAVGLANGANPIAIIVPCHRVIGASGSLTGYGGGLERKQWLLDHEKRWQTDRLF